MVQYIERNLDNNCLAQREKQQLEKQIRWRKIPKISPSKYKPPKPATQKPLC